MKENERKHASEGREQKEHRRIFASILKEWTPQKNLLL